MWGLINPQGEVVI